MALRTKFSTSDERRLYFKKWVQQRKTREAVKPDTPYWKECLERLRRYHKYRHSFDPEYMTDDFREYRIKQLPNGKWYIAKYMSNVPMHLRGLYGSFKDAETKLVNWIKQYNKGHARYPGCPKPRPTSSTEHFLKDWSPKPAR